MNPTKQQNPYKSPWPIWTQIILIFWRFSWRFFCSWTPKFLNSWRLTVLKIFGANISGIPFVHSTAKIQIPWHLTLHHRACLGESVCIYCLGEIEVGKAATVAQEAYLCGGTHDFATSSMQLITKKIMIRENAFIGVRALILPGVTIEENAIVGAQAVVTKDVLKNDVVAGNPARSIGLRKFHS